MNELIVIAEFVATAAWRTWPLFLASIVLSVLIRALKLDGLIHRVFSANVGKAILLATLLGAFSPFCSCTVVPVIAAMLASGVPLYLNNFGALPIVSGLLAQGMQPGAAIAFLIAGPVTTIPAMTAVYGVVEKRIFALYLGISLTGAIIAGSVVNLILG